MDELKLLTRKQVAELLGVNIQTVDKLLRTGQLTKRRVGRTVRILFSDVIDYVERSVVG